MLDIEKQFPGVKALDHAKLQLRPGSIHALMGENGAGKSTLMKCLFGIYKKDAGSIRMNGKEINFTSPRNALDHGVAMVHQELNQVLYRSVMENMWLGRFPLKAGLVDHKKMYNDTKAFPAADWSSLRIGPARLSLLRTSSSAMSRSTARQAAAPSFPALRANASACAIPAQPPLWRASATTAVNI